MPAEIDAAYDLRGATWPALIADALMVFAEADDRVIRVVGKPSFGDEQFIEVVMEEAPLKAAMIRYGLDILGLSILIFGIVVAVLFFGTTRVLSLVEGRSVEVMLGERMPRRPLYPPRESSMFKRIGGMFKDPRTWSTLLYFVLMLPLGIVYFTLAVTGIALSLSFILASLAHLGWMLGIVEIDWADHIHFNDTLVTPWWLADPLLFVLGIALLFGLLHLARGVGKFQGGLAKALLVN